MGQSNTITIYVSGEEQPELPAIGGIGLIIAIAIILLLLGDKSGTK